MSYELAQKYADFKIPSEFKRGYGAINFIKMMMDILVLKVDKYIKLVLSAAG